MRLFAGSSWRGFTLPAVLALLSLSIACTSETATESAPLVGAWRSIIQFETSAFAETTRLRVRRMIGPNVFEARYEFFSTATSDADAFMKGAGWLPSGRGVFTERIEVAPDAQTFTSTIRYEAFGKRGEPLEGGGTARGEGVRIGF